MPLPLNHRTKRVSIGFAGVPVAGSAAYAVPIELNIEIRGGNPTAILAPATVMPFSMLRLEVLSRLVITCDTRYTPSCLGFGLLRKFSHNCERHNHFLELELRFPEGVGHFQNQRTIRFRVQPPGSIAEILPDDTFLALRTLRQNGAEFSRRIELRIRNAGHGTRSIDL